MGCFIVDFCYNLLYVYCFFKDGGRDKMAKKKVSFDIEEEDLSNIKVYCEAKDLKLSDFFRAAAVEKYRMDVKYLVIWVWYLQKVKKHIIERDKYDITLFAPDPDLSEITGATFEGIIGFKNPNNYEVKSEIDFIIQESQTGRVRFFTK